MRVRFRFFGLLALGAALSGASLADPFPSGVAQVIGPCSPGGAVDTTGRLLSDRLHEAVAAAATNPERRTRLPARGGEFLVAIWSRRLPTGFRSWRSGRA